MALADRKYGKHLSLMTVNGQEVASLTTQVVIDWEPLEEECATLAEAATRHQYVADDYTVRFSVVYDSADANQGNILGLILDQDTDLNNEVVWAVLAASGGRTYTSTGYVKSASHNIPDDGQTIDFVIVPAGAKMSTSA